LLLESSSITSYIASNPAAASSILVFCTDSVVYIFDKSGSVPVRISFALDYSLIINYICPLLLQRKDTVEIQYSNVIFELPAELKTIWHAEVRASAWSALQQLSSTNFIQNVNSHEEEADVDEFDEHLENADSMFSDEGNNFDLKKPGSAHRRTFSSPVNSSTNTIKSDQQDSAKKYNMGRTSLAKANSGSGVSGLGSFTLRSSKVKKEQEKIKKERSESRNHSLKLWLHRIAVEGALAINTLGPFYTEEVDISFKQDVGWLLRAGIFISLTLRLY
jgi:hypothetical protein